MKSIRRNFFFSDTSAVGGRTPSNDNARRSHHCASTSESENLAHRMVGLLKRWMKSDPPNEYVGREAFCGVVKVPSFLETANLEFALTFVRVFHTRYENSYCVNPNREK